MLDAGQISHFSSGTKVHCSQTMYSSNLKWSVCFLKLTCLVNITQLSVCHIKSESLNAFSIVYVTIARNWILPLFYVSSVATRPGELSIMSRPSRNHYHLVLRLRWNNMMIVWWWKLIFSSFPERWKCRAIEAFNKILIQKIHLVDKFSRRKCEIFGSCNDNIENVDLRSLNIGKNLFPWKILFLKWLWRQTLNNNNVISFSLKWKWDRKLHWTLIKFCLAFHVFRNHKS